MHQKKKYMKSLYAVNRQKNPIYFAQWWNKMGQGRWPCFQQSMITGDLSFLLNPEQKIDLPITLIQSSESKRLTLKMIRKAKKKTESF